MKKNLVWLIIGLGLLIAQTASAGWVQTNGPWRGNISALAVSGNNIFAGSNGGIFLSTNNAKSWTAINNGLTNMNITSIAASGSIVFAGTGNGSIFRSTDYGMNWALVESRVIYDAVRSLAISGSNIFATIGYGGTLRSIDNGINWASIIDSTGEAAATALAANDSNIIVNDNGIYISANNGRSWSQVSIPGEIEAFAFSGSNIFAGTYSESFYSTYGEIYLSINNGDSWTVVDSVSPGYEGVIAFAVIGNNVFAGNGKGVYLSVNTGKSWIAVNNGLTTKNVTALAVNGNNLFAGTSGGLFLSTNNGKSWTEADSGINCANVMYLAHNDSDILAGTSGGFFLSANSGLSWMARNSGLSNAITNTIAVSGNNIFIGGDSSVFLSPNNGISWTTIGTKAPTPWWGRLGWTVTSLFSNGNNVIAAYVGPSGDAHCLVQQLGIIYSSTNGGSNWSPVLNISSASSIILTGFNNNIFAATLSPFCYPPGPVLSTVYFSNDNGANWSLSSNNVQVQINSLIANDSNVFAGTSSNGVLISSDNGKTWTPTNTGLPDSSLGGRSILSFAISGNTIFAGTNGNGIFFSTNNGKSWTAFNSGLPSNINVQSMTLSGGNIFAGTTNGGVWRRPLYETGVKSPQPQAGLFNQTELKIFSQSRLNPNIAIQFSLSHSDQVAVKIYNLSGREIATLVNKNLGAGEHRLSWDTKNVAAGCYAVKMQVGSNVLVKNIPVSH